MGQAFECDWCKGLYIGEPANNVHYRDTRTNMIGDEFNHPTDQLCEGCSDAFLDVRAKCRQKAEKP